MTVCNHCRAPTQRVFAVDGRQLWDVLSCSPECDQDLSDLLDGVPYNQVQTRLEGRRAARAPAPAPSAAQTE